MWQEETARDARWWRDRVARHGSELTRLAGPAVMMRLGVVGLGMVDTAMVGHYATRDLAWLNLANQSLIMFALVAALGLLMGTLVFTANAYGADDMAECGRVWRRSLPFAGGLAVLILIVLLPAELWLGLLGQPEDMAAESGRIARILALGMPAHLLFIHSTMFLEGVKRTEVGFYLMMAANVINAGLNYLLIYGHGGLPEMGAAGSAWTSTVVRWFLAGSLICYVWWSPSLTQYGLRKPHGQKWADWSAQRQMGYASCVSLTAEVLAFGALAIFAGWIGTVPLAAHGVVYQVLGVPLMIAVGIGVASSVRVGIAFARRDRLDTLLAGLMGLAVTLVIAGAFALAIAQFTAPALGIFTDDRRVVEILLPITLVFTLGMLLDALQMVMAGALRGLKETWWPTALQTTAFVGVMLPVCYILAFPMDRGLRGLMEGTLAGVTVSFFFQLARFRHLVSLRR